MWSAPSGCPRIDRRFLHRPDQGAASRAPWTPRARRGVLAENVAVAERLAPSVVASSGLGCGRPPLDSPGSPPGRAKSLVGHSHHRSRHSDPPVAFGAGCRRQAHRGARRDPKGSLGGSGGTLPQPRHKGQERPRRQAQCHSGDRGEDVPPTLGSVRGTGSGPSQPVDGAGVGQYGLTRDAGRSRDGSRPQRDKISPRGRRWRGRRRRGGPQGGSPGRRRRGWR